MLASGLPKLGRPGGVVERIGGGWVGWLGVGTRRIVAGGDGVGERTGSGSGRSEREKDLRFMPLRHGERDRRERKVRFDGRSLSDDLEAKLG